MPFLFSCCEHEKVFSSEYVHVLKSVWNYTSVVDILRCNTFVRMFKLTFKLHVRWKAESRFKLLCQPYAILFGEGPHYKRENAKKEGSGWGAGKLCWHIKVRLMRRIQQTASTQDLDIQTQDIDCLVTNKNICHLKQCLSVFLYNLLCTVSKTRFLFIKVKGKKTLSVSKRFIVYFIQYNKLSRFFYLQKANWKLHVSIHVNNMVLKSNTLYIYPQFFFLQMASSLTPSFLINLALEMRSLYCISYFRS